MKRLPYMFQYLRDNWLCRFLGRLMLLLIVGAALFTFLGVAICKFDSLDVVLRATSYFAPYHSSVPFLLVILSIAIICCIPGGPTALLRLSKRIKALGPLELFPDEDPDIDHKQLIVEAENEVNALPPTDGKGKAQKLVKLVSEKLNRVKQKKSFLLQQHAGRIFATISKTSIRTSLCPLFFDACLKQNDKQVLVRILSADAQHLMAQIEDIEIFYDLIPANLQSTVVVNIVLYAKRLGMECEPFKQYLPTISAIENRIRNRPNLHLFRYSVDDSNAVRPED